MTEPPTLQVILDFNADRFVGAGRKWLDDAKVYDACATAIQAVHARHLEATDGTAETARAKFLLPYRQDLDAYSDALEEAGNHAVAGGEELGRVQALARGLMDQHGQSGELELMEDGNVYGPKWDWEASDAITDALWAYREQFGDAAQQIHGRIDAALTKFDNVNGKQPKNIRFFGGPGGIGEPAKDEGTDPDANAEAMRIATGSEEVPKDPKRLRELWSKWDDAEKAAVAAKHPDIGDYGGIPAVDRDHYNRDYLKVLNGQKLAQILQAQNEHPSWNKDHWDGNPGSRDGREWRDWSSRMNALQHELDGYNKVQAVLDRSAKDGYPRFLGLIDDKGHTAVSVGNPDFATKVDTFVPGTGQDMAAIEGSDDKSRDLYRSAHNEDRSLGPNAVSVTTWMGYDRPMSVNPLDGQTWAGDPDYAHNGAKPLGSWQDGIRAAHDDAAAGGRAFQTVIGHSYGTTVVGAAATEDHHLDADAVIAVGSPGMFTDSRTGMNINPDARVFVAQAENDIIHVTHVGDGLGGDPLGPDPTLWIDATQFRTDPGSIFHPGDAHSSYFVPGSTGMVNMGKIIDGIEPDHVD